MKVPNASLRPAPMFGAFADPTRLRLLHLLYGGELCQGDVMGALRLPQAKISRHLRYLLRAGLVRVRKQGLWSFYALAPAGSRLHKGLLSCLVECSSMLPEIAVDTRRAGVIRRGGGCCPT